MSISRNITENKYNIKKKTMLFDGPGVKVIIKQTEVPPIQTNRLISEKWT